MRCFIAVDLPGELKRQIGSIIDKINSASKGLTSSEDIKWVPHENIHLTLKFLGDVKEEVLASVGQRLKTVCRIHKPFNISIKGTGAFPSHKKPNVLWVGIERSEELNKLHIDIDIAMSELGFEREERPHAPHLTIGRVKNREDIAPVIKSLYEFREQFFGTTKVAEVHLIKSILKPSGAEYSKLASFRLKGEMTE